MKETFGEVSQTSAANAVSAPSIDFAYFSTLRWISDSERRGSGTRKPQAAVAASASKVKVSCCRIVPLDQSDLLRSGLGSTVPGLVQVRNRGARRQMEIRERSIVCQLPDLGEHRAARRFAAVFALDQPLDIQAKTVKSRLLVPPG